MRVHVLSERSSRLMRAIRLWNEHNDNLATICPITNAGHPVEESDGVVVIDCLDASEVPPVRQIQSGIVSLLVMSRGADVSAEWLPYVTRGNVVPLLVPRIELLAELATTIGQAITNIALPEKVARALMTDFPELQRAEPLARAILMDPIRVRRPRDLAIATKLTRPELTSQCRAVGLRNTDHLITIIRWLAYNHLRDLGLPARQSRRACGIIDSSNFRRQLRRVGSHYKPPCSESGSSKEVRGDCTLQLVICTLASRAGDIALLVHDK